MEFLRCYKTQSDFVEDLINNDLPDIRIVYIEDENKTMFGKMLEAFILVNKTENAFLGDDMDSFVVFDVE